jgi:hypothetical protein
MKNLEEDSLTRNYLLTKLLEEKGFSEIIVSFTLPGLV